jgi:hypothetical protein
MIINGGSRKNAIFFQKHLLKTTENDAVRITEIRGLASDNLPGAFREMRALASGTRCECFFYHANLNPREDEELTPEQWDKAVDTLEKCLGLEGHSRFVVEHEKLGRTHRHVIWSRIDADTMTAVSDSHNFAAHERAAREIEREFGLDPVRGVHVREVDDKRPARRAKNWETFRGHETGLDPKVVSAELTALWQESDSGKAFSSALEDYGYTLCRGDRRNFCVIDPAGHEHSLARRIDGTRAADIRQRMADVDRESLPSVAEGRQRRENIHKDPESVQEVRQEKAMDRFLTNIVHAVEETGETALHDMGESRWERTRAIVDRVRARAVEAWQAAQKSWREFIRDEERGGGPKLER